MKRFIPDHIKVTVYIRAITHNIPILRYNHSMMCMHKCVLGVIALRINGVKKYIQTLDQVSPLTDRYQSSEVLLPCSYFTNSIHRLLLT